MREIIHSVLTTPPKEIPGKTLKVIAKNISSLFNHCRSRFLPSYCVFPCKSGDALQTRFSMPGENYLKQYSEQTHALTGHYLSHSFDLLGSGWTKVQHGINCRGLEGNRFPPQPQVRADRQGQWLAGRINRGNLPRSQKIWSLVDSDYAPIDWHLDFISGYR